MSKPEALRFQEIPEIDREELPRHLSRILSLAPGMPSFGAFKVRDGGLILADKLIDALEGDKVFEIWRTRMSSLHTDEPGYEDRVDFTVHVLTKGVVEAIILAGYGLYKGHSQDATGLFEGGVPEFPLIVSDHASALRSSLQINDVLVFDHTQPHAFKQVGDKPRSSTAIHVEPLYDSSEQ